MCGPGEARCVCLGGVEACIWRIEKKSLELSGGEKRRGREG